MKTRLFATAVLLTFTAAASRLEAASLHDKDAWPLLPGQEATVHHCVGKVLDSGTSTGVIDDADMRYRIFVPPNYDSSIAYPVVVWLHGLGAEGNNNTAQLTGDKAGVLSFVQGENRYKYPCIIVAPQRPGAKNNTSTQWYAHYKDHIFAILHDVACLYTIDTNRLYIAGVSWGAMGAWAFLTNNSPSDTYHWAAGIAIAGNGGQSSASSKAGTLAGFPLWAFHANNDATVNIFSSNGTDVMIDKIRQAGGSPFYTRYNTGNHSTNVWNSAFSTPGLLPWLMSQRLEDSPPPQREVVNAEPTVRITGYRVGATMEMEGVVTGLSGSTNEVAWWNSRITSRTGTVSGTSNGGKNITIPGAGFTSNDIGSRLFINNAIFNTWPGYLITAVQSSTSATVDITLPSGGKTYSNATWEICPPGHRRNPAIATGTSTWTASDIPLSSGTNIIAATGRTSSFSTLGGFTYLGGDTVTVVYSTPSGDSTAPILAVDGPTEVVTSQSSITLSGSASDAGGSVASVTWSTDHGGSGTATGTTTWTTGSIPLDPGYNVVTVKATDTAGNIAVKWIKVMRNEAPTAPTVATTTPKDTGVIIDVLTSGTDSDAQPQVRSISSVGSPTAPSKGTATIYGDKIRYMPSAGATGADSFSYTITDGASTTTGLVNVTINGTFQNSPTVRFSQDFAISGTGDFVGNPPNSTTQVNDLSAEVDGGTWSINSGRLQLARTGASGSNNGAGFTRFTDLSGPPHFVKVALDFSVSGVNSSATIAEFEFANLTSKLDYNSNLSNAALHNRFAITGKGNGQIAFVVGGNTSPTFSASGDHQVEWYVNSGTTVKQYQGPDGYLYSVDPDRSSFWYNGELVWDNVARTSTFSGTSIADFRVRSVIPSAITLAFDKIEIIEQDWSIGGGDTQAPSVTITNPASSPYHTSSATLPTLSGTASDNVGVTSVTWHNAATSVSGTATFTAPNWSASSISLQSGTNVITVTAKDAANNTGTDTVVVVYTANTAPVAGDDSYRAVSGVQTSFAVLANDIDNDGPAALTVTNVTAPSHGTATSGTTHVLYTATTGYYGADSFTYTAYDGIASDTATVTVDVIKAANLSGQGLAAANIGSGSAGGSAELNDTQWEISGTGAGIQSTTDSYHRETKTLAGNFTIVAKIDSLSGNSNTRAGLVVAEGSAAGARLSAISISTNGTVHSLGRTGTNASVQTQTASGTWSPGSTWLLIERIDDMVRTAVSDDGTTFEECGRYIITGLASSLEAGLWASGDTGSNSKCVISDFSSVLDPIVFSQDFLDWTSGTSNYVSSTPTRRQFNDLSAASPTAWTVSGGRLILSFGSSNAGSGFIRYVSGTMAPSAVVVRMNVAMTNVTNSGPIGYVDIGSMTSFVDYANTTNSGLMGQRLTFKRGNGTFKVDTNGSDGTSSFPADGSSIPVEWYINYSGSSIDYLAPDSTVKTLASGYSDVWIDGNLEHQDVPRPSNFNASSLGGVRFRTTFSSTTGQTFEFDEIDIRELTP
jgi:predicted esterase